MQTHSASGSGRLSPVSMVGLANENIYLLLDVRDTSNLGWQDEESGQYLLGTSKDGRLG